jgi:hypothetical protein
MYMGLLVKPVILTSCIYKPAFGNAESRLFLFAAQCLTLNQCRKLPCGTVVCKHFARYQGYPNYKWDLIRYAKVKQFFNFRLFKTNHRLLHRA